MLHLILVFGYQITYRGIFIILDNTCNPVKGEYRQFGNQLPAKSHPSFK